MVNLYLTLYFLILLVYYVYFIISASFTAKMKFIVKDCDPITGEVQDDGYEEDYRVYNNNFNK